MWKMRVVLESNASALEAALADDWEPFAVLSMGINTKIYLKRKEKVASIKKLTKAKENGSS